MAPRFAAVFALALLGLAPLAQAKDTCVVSDIGSTDADSKNFAATNLGRRASIDVQGNVVTVSLDAVNTSGHVAKQNSARFDVVQLGKFDLLAVRETAGGMDTLVMPAKSRAKYKATLAFQGMNSKGLNALRLECGL